MTRKTSRPGASVATSATEVDDIEDDISMTSTIPDVHQEDDEFAVENVLAERRTETGMQYLVEWSGFALHESTWEPHCNLGDELVQVWKENKRKQELGEAERFDVQTYHNAQIKAESDKAERHRRRNAKRRKIGLQQTLPFTEPNEESSVEAVEDASPGVDEETCHRTSRLPSKSHLARRLPTKTHGKPRSMSLSSITNVSRAPRLAATPGRKYSSVKQAEKEPQTGYQGTARPLSASSAKPFHALASANRAKSRSSTSRFTAKRSVVAARPNIFSGGTTRKSRNLLGNIMSDPSKEPKVLDKHRLRRLMEKASRDKEDRAPDPNTVYHNLINISAGSERQRSALSRGRQMLAQKIATSAELMDENLQTDAPRKKRKSVRFMNTEHMSHGSEPIDLDETAQSKQPRSSHSMRSPSPVLAPQSPPDEDMSDSRETAGERTATNVRKRKLSIQDYRTKQTHGYEKMIRVGGSTSMEVVFTGLPKDLQAPWFVSFLAEDVLRFRHSVLAQDLFKQRDYLMPTRLGEGTIATKTAELTSRIEATSEHLRASLTGVYSYHPEYSILVYPTKCEEWKFCTTGSESPAATSLRFVVFLPRQSQDLGGFLRPLPSEVASIVEEDNNGKSGSSEAQKSAREIVTGKLLGFQYKDLLPARQNPQAHNFFLAFPASRAAATFSLFQWLRACNPNCRVFASFTCGSWAAFREAIRQGPGVVIIHELLGWNVRRFPNLASSLIDQYDEYWSFTEPVDSMPLYPSMPLPESGELGRVQLTRLFPWRTAILVTPSFFVSEPARGLDLLHWFLSRWASCKPSNYKLVTAWNIHEYLLVLADEKQQELNELQRQNNPVDFKIAAAASGLSQDECDRRYAAVHIATELHTVRKRRLGMSGGDESDCSLVYADQFIDPNDEQSLVNWFGWWSLLRADQLRKFFVVGSRGRSTPEYHGRQKWERRLPVPKYSPLTINDPDGVLEVAQELQDDRSGQMAVVGPPLPSPACTEPAPMNGKAGVDPVFGVAGSDLMVSDEAHIITQYLDDVNTLAKSAPGPQWIWKLNRHTVSWDQMPMADHFGDKKMNYQTFKQWLMSTSPFAFLETQPLSDTTRATPRGYNTYVAFFYTIREDWDPGRFTRGRRPVRHPWLGIYRPCNPHIRPYSKTEVLIWDAAAKARFPGSQVPAEADLLWMQRAFIKHIREHGAEKNPGTVLTRAWLGGFECPEACMSCSHLDTSMKFLQRMLEDIKTHLPAPDSLLSEQGFRPIRLDSETKRMKRVDEDGDMSTGMRSHVLGISACPGKDPDQDSTEDEDARIIFHPPRSTKLQPGQRTSCQNRLHEEARLARLGSAPGTLTHMRYSYPPTIEWYEQQRTEGRGFEHIQVDEWKRIFDRFEIGDATMPRGQGKSGTMLGAGGRPCVSNSSSSD